MNKVPAPKFTITYIGFEKKVKLQHCVNESELLLLPPKVFCKEPETESLPIPIHIYFFDGLIKLDQAALETSRRERARILFAGDFKDFESYLACVQAGSYGCVALINMQSEIMPAIEAALQKQIYISPAFAGIMENYLRGRLHAGNQTKIFTQQEHKLIQLLTTGALYKEIAWKMSISENTVRSHVRNIYSKFKVHSKTELTQKVLKFNLTSWLLCYLSDYIACLCY